MRRNILWGSLTFISLAGIMYFTYILESNEKDTQTYPEIEPMINVCDENSFLECTNKNIIECKNAINLTISYCDKKHFSDVDWNNPEISMKAFTECTKNSILAYFDSDGKKLNACLSKTDYGQRLEKTMKEMMRK